ncbi:ATP-dependent DNA helicase YKU80 SCDLUD_004018 [Saccharomycodes ludwigii]|uniref:ATP-dependent DNA helicase YKU80 n=1 Tax=Saccharomycodes ludwigii TaxID=36035 RepID=UPI001E85EC75|nr:hypothetical protein SCDLUD_004018 [Saccharomycodes ludwigii]KAH3899732.1 hypothetical protein SCDLUD_004018 [Saccharomycodes ludwigii]
MPIETINIIIDVAEVTDKGKTVKPPNNNGDIFWKIKKYLYYSLYYNQNMLGKKNTIINKRKRNASGFTRYKNGKYLSCKFVNTPNLPYTMNSYGIENFIDFYDMIELDDNYLTIEKILTGIFSKLQEIEKIKKENSKCGIDKCELTISQGLIITKTNINNLLFNNPEFHNLKSTTDIIHKIIVLTDDLNRIDLDEEDSSKLSNEFNKDHCKFEVIYTGNVFKSGNSDNTSYVYNWNAFLCLIKSHEILDINTLLTEYEDKSYYLPRAIAIFKGDLILGVLPSGEENGIGERNGINGTTGIKIKVECYLATKKVGAVNRKTVLSTANGYKPVKSVVDYRMEIFDDDRERSDQLHNTLSSNKTFVSVSKDEITKAYRYGAQYVVLPDSLTEQLGQLNLNDQSCINDKDLYLEPNILVIGMLSLSLLPREYLMGEMNYLVSQNYCSQSDNLANLMAFESLIDTLIAFDSCLMARYLQRKASEVQICALIPHIVKYDGVNEDNYNNGRRIFLMCRLPYTEDLRKTELPKITDAVTSDTIDGVNSGQLDDYMMKYVLNKSNKININFNKNYFPTDNNVQTSDHVMPLSVTPSKVKKLINYEYINRLCAGSVNLETVRASHTGSCYDVNKDASSANYDIDAFRKKLNIKKVIIQEKVQEDERNK